MFNKIATYVDKKSKLSYICFNFDVDGFFVVYYMYQISSKLNQPSHFCQLNTNTSCLVTFECWYQAIMVWSSLLNW
jgi:hypothetical protein